MKKEKPEPMFRVQQLRPPKLKDNPPNRSRIALHLKDQFGFMPEILIIDKVRGESNKLIISAVLPKEMADRLDKEEKDADNKSTKGSKLPSKQTKDNS